jgi:hypothetical protein
VLPLLRIALAGTMKGPAVFEMMESFRVRGNRWRGLVE